MTTKSGSSIAISACLTVIAFASSGFAQQIKKKTELVLKKQNLAFTVAEAKEEKGRGNGAGTAFLRGAAAGSSGNWGSPGVADEPDHSDNPDYNPAFDPAVGVSLRAGGHCYARQGDKAVVLGADGARILVELDRVAYRYTGSREMPAQVPAITDGALGFSEVANTPACLQKVKLWIDHDVFVALEGLPTPSKKPTAKSRSKGGDSDDDKDAVRRAMGKQ